MTRTFIRNATVATVDASNTIYDDGGVIFEDDRIVDVGLTAELEDEYQYDTTIDGTNTTVLPGLVNLHVHSGYIRGLAEDLPVFEWLKEHVDPTHRALEDSEARAAYELCYAEMAKAGITCTLDMYRYMHHAADVVDEFGMRSVLSPYVADREGYEYFESLEDNVDLVESRHMDADGRVRVWFALEHLTYCKEETYYEVAELAEKYGVGIHTHGEESIQMANDLAKEYGKRPIEIFDERGILGPKTVLAHCVWLTQREMELLARTNTSVAHCPTSNEKLASGVAPITELLNYDVNIGLGTDGIKENNRLDIIQEMKNATLLQKVHTLDATVVPAEQALRMGTINGAKALGLDDEIGSLEPGKKADLIMIDMEAPHLSPMLSSRNAVPNVVHAATPADVETVFVDGNPVVDDGEFLPKDEREIIETHTEVTRELVERRDEMRASE